MRKRKGHLNAAYQQLGDTMLSKEMPMISENCDAHIELKTNDTGKPICIHTNLYKIYIDLSCSTTVAVLLSACDFTMRKYTYCFSYRISLSSGLAYTERAEQR